MGLQGWHLVIIVILALLLFGAPKLPGLARSMGQSLRIFKSEVRQMKDEGTSAPAADETVEDKIIDAAPYKNNA
ncbi:Sec-independent protein translocase TatA [Arthrobacter sp. MYb227]|uniref:Sec-independent protein translocase subunit TatA n=1 Tax=Arthrobacter sp. MYb227 TaxID=1848601 RepID=UPI000CFB9137|nr:Sec-independent protein translocase subunit TatA [Arthrobacter sp. MYb227]PQZ87738.1 Sec-independent protein translocase TatA [Arthrobacter sp. MYb227]